MPPVEWCGLLHPESTPQYPLISIFSGVVSAPLWNSSISKFAGMLTVLDIIHLIQYYYHTASYDVAAADVEHFRLESLRGMYLSCIIHSNDQSSSFQKSRKN